MPNEFKNEDLQKLYDVLNKNGITLKDTFQSISTTLEVVDFIPRGTLNTLVLEPIEADYLAEYRIDKRCPWSMKSSHFGITLFSSYGTNQEKNLVYDGLHSVILRYEKRNEEDS